ncbi:MAG: AraC family transcriptional regulator [Sporolactobacillus sp.]
MESIRFYFASINEESYRIDVGECRLILPIAGEIDWLTAGSSYRIDHTHVCLLTASVDQFRNCSEMNENLIVRLPKEYARAYIKSDVINHNGFVWKIDQRLQPVKDLIIQEVNANNEEEAILLLNYLLHKVAVQTVTASLRFIQQHYTEKIDIRMLAELEHYTPTYYCDWFKRKMKMTPIEYVHFLRIHRAKELLQDSNLSMLSIAYLLGYEYNASFTRMFKKYERMAPSEYRSGIHMRAGKSISPQDCTVLN